MSAAHLYWQRVSESLRSGEWRCTECDAINSIEVWFCSECGCDPDGKRAPEEGGYR